MKKADDLAMLYLLHWALQEEVILSPTLGRSERLEEAVLSFYLLLHYFDLSFLLRSERVTQRFNKGRTTAVTFAEESAWSRILNHSLALIYFIIHAPGDWSFSRLETHCLENFFGFVHRDARSHDRSRPAFQIIAKTARVSFDMQHLSLEVVHRRRDNVNGVLIEGASVELEEPLMKWAYELCESFAAMAGPGMTEAELPMDRQLLKDVLTGWCEQDQHHEHDQAYKADFISSPSNSRIAAWNRQADIHNATYGELGNHPDLESGDCDG
jgi:hypothetical protein